MARLTTTIAVQLDLDGATEARLSELGARLELISGLKTMRQFGNVHHVTLGIYHEAMTEDFVRQLTIFAQRTSPLNVQLAAIGMFQGPPSTLFLAPVVTGALLDLHSQFHAAVGSRAGPCWDYYRPGAWVPHVTLSMNDTRDALSAAFAEMAVRWTPAPARLDALRVIDVPSARTLHDAGLSKTSASCRA